MEGENERGRGGRGGINEGGVRGEDERGRGGRRG